MKQTALIAALVVTSTAFAQEVPAFSYQWSASGKQYATLGYPLEQVAKNLSFDFVAGTEVKTSNAPAFGLGFNYMIEREKFFAKAGVFALFPQKAQPDFGFGVTFGVKF